MTRTSVRIKRGIFFSLLAAMLVYFALLVYGDGEKVLASFRQFRVGWLPAIVGLVIGNFLLRFTKWQYFLGVLGIRMRRSVSADIFMSGMFMTLTPGKAGELVKAYFVREVTGHPISRTAAVVFAERFSDFFAVVLLAALGSFSFSSGRTLLAISLGLSVVLLCVFLNRRIARRILGALEHVPLVRNFSHGLGTLYESARSLLAWRPLIVALLLSLFAWFCECVAFFVVLHALGAPVGLLPAIFIYAFATLVGALVLLPGGLGATDGSLTGLLIVQGIGKDAAAASTMLIRAFTLWFAVGVSICWLLVRRRQLVPDTAELPAESFVSEPASVYDK